MWFIEVMIVIFSDSNLMAFEGILDFVVEDLSILITGLSENPPSVEEKKVGWMDPHCSTRFLWKIDSK